MRLFDAWRRAHPDAPELPASGWVIDEELEPPNRTMACQSCGAAIKVALPIRHAARNVVLLVGRECASHAVDALALELWTLRRDADKHLHGWRRSAKGTSYFKRKRGHVLLAGPSWWLLKATDDGWDEPRVVQRGQARNLEDAMLRATAAERVVGRT